MKIIPPEGYEIDKNKSTFEEVIFKRIIFEPIEEQAKTWKKIQELNGRKELTQWYIDPIGDINDIPIDNSDILDTRSHVPSKDIARKVRALCQSFVIAEHYNSGWQPNWEDPNEIKYVISQKNIILPVKTYSMFRPYFMSSELAAQAYENNKEIFDIFLMP